jgi:hypothetical protein
MKDFAVLLLLFVCIKLFSNSDFEKIPNIRLLDIETYEGSGQIVHPDIVYLPMDNKQYKFYLAYTPYPNYNDKFENPCIGVSNDGINFIEPQKGINPLVKEPLYDHNNDCDLYFNSIDDHFYLYYLETMRPDSENVVLLKSKDFITWSDPETIIRYNIKEEGNFMLSPAVTKYKEDYFMFYTIQRDELVVEYMKSESCNSWSKDNIFEAKLILPDFLKPWHVDVFKGDDNLYYMLLSCINRGDFKDQSLYLATSHNLEDWFFLEEPIIKNTPSFYNAKSLYRSSGLVSNKSIYIWFSFADNENKWHIGSMKKRLDDIFK